LPEVSSVFLNQTYEVPSIHCSRFGVLVITSSYFS